MVGSATRNAAAPCAVVRPPSSRSVNATWASSTGAGWQHMEDQPEPIIDHPSCVTVGHLVTGRLCVWRRQPGGLVEQLPAAAFPSQPIQRPVPRGRGDPTARIGRQSVTSPPRSTATANASWTASSARSTSPRTRIRVATAWPDSSRKIRPISSTSGPPTARARGTVPTRRRYRRTATTRWACRSRRRSAAPSPTPRRGRTRR
jgi:hypothetical protein